MFMCSPSNFESKTLFAVYVMMKFKYLSVSNQVLLTFNTTKTIIKECYTGQEKSFVLFMHASAVLFLK